MDKNSNLIEKNYFKYSICTNCANVISTKSNGFVVECPKCLYMSDFHKIERLLDYAHRAVHMGYNYRKQYEEDLKIKGNLNTRNFLVPLDEILCWVALTGIAAIVGHITVETSKSILRKIKDAIKTNNLNNSMPEVNILFDTEKFDEFNKYINDFYSDLRDVHPDVRRALIQEMIVDKMSEDDMPILMDALKAKLQKKLPDIQRIVTNDDKPVYSDFNGIWCTVDNEE